MCTSWSKVIVNVTIMIKKCSTQISRKGNTMTFLKHFLYEMIKKEKKIFISLIMIQSLYNLIKLFIKKYIIKIYI
jgi:hypothetical protein